jgi:hypothetical protein
MVSDSPALHSRWLLLLKTEISLCIDALLQDKMRSNYVPQTKFGRHIMFTPFLIILLLLLSFFLSSVKSLSDTFLGDALIKLYETL